MSFPSLRVSSCSGVAFLITSERALLVLGKMMLSRASGDIFIMLKMITQFLFVLNFRDEQNDKITQNC